MTNNRIIEHSNDEQNEQLNYEQSNCEHSNNRMADEELLNSFSIRKSGNSKIR